MHIQYFNQLDFSQFYSESKNFLSSSLSFTSGLHPNYLMVFDKSIDEAFLSPYRAGSTMKSYGLVLPNNAATS
jgi:hypothetical protein